MLLGYRTNNGAVKRQVRGQCGGGGLL